MKPALRFGVVGTGMIAGVVSDVIAKSTHARLTAVSSRRLENAEKFVASRGGATAVQGAEALVAREDVDAVYIAIPTVFKEPVALAAIAAGKHVLVDKPFVNRESVLRMTSAAAAQGVVFMDATHFVHHPRTAAIRAATAATIGAPRSLHTTFYFPFSDSNNIRFDRRQEPMTALGDMAWYSMRAVVEYLRPTGEVTVVATVAERDPATAAIIRAEGLIAFASGEVSTYDIGYTAASIAMDLQLVGTSGVIEMDDFVLDWNNSFAFKNSGIPVGYLYHTGMATRADRSFIPTPATIPQEVSMIDDFAELAAALDDGRRTSYAAATLKTQQYLDAAWAALA